MTRIVIKQSPKNRQWYFHVKGANGRIMAASEGYTRHAGAVRAANRLCFALRGEVHVGPTPRPRRGAHLQEQSMKPKKKPGKTGKKC